MLFHFLKVLIFAKKFKTIPNYEKFHFIALPYSVGRNIC